MRFVDTSAVTVRIQDQIEAADGSLLSADIYLPPGGGKRPVLLTRTPYDNNRAIRPREDGRSAGEAPARRWQRLAANGYVVVAADVRGRGDSDGTFTPFIHEASDGAECVRWAGALDECDGRVGMFGAGYAGWCALAAAIESGGVGALFVQSPFGGASHGMPYENGALRLDWLFWMHLIGGRTLQPVALPRWDRIWRHVPLLELDEALGRADIWWKSWISDPTAALAVATELLERANDLRGPIKLSTGWWDQGLGATRTWWDRLTTNRIDARAELVVGPWDTRGVRHPRADAGGIAWGPEAVLDPDAEMIRWFNEQFSTNPPTGTSVQTFVTGLNEWRHQETWPREGSRLQFWLSSSGSANTRRGNGRLLAGATPPATGTDTFIHDPATPVRWHPNTDSFDAHPCPPLSLDTAHITVRDDALIYRSEPVTEDLRLIGQARLRIHAQTDRDDADWIALLADLFPGGHRTVVLSHAVVRAATTRGFQPNVPFKYDLTFSDVDHLLLPGHSLEVTIVSSLFPLYARNLGQRGYLSATASSVATHRILHGAGHESALTVQVAKP